MMTTSVPVAVIGFGFAARTFHVPFVLKTEGLDLRVISSSDANKVKDALATSDVNVEVLSSPYEAVTHSDIELVVIATPNDSHFPLAKSALESGKHVVVDKPFTLDSSQARALAKLAKSKGRLLSVFQNRRYDSDFLHVKRAIEHNSIGPVVEFVSQFDRYRPKVQDRWREQSLPGSGVWFDLGPHLADQALSLFGPPAEISANIACTRPGSKTNDWAQVTLHYPPNGDRGPLFVTLHASMLVASPSDRFVVHGLGGSLVKTSQAQSGKPPLDLEYGVDSEPLLIYGPNGLVGKQDGPPGAQARYYTEVKDAILGRGSNPVSPEQAVTLMLVLETAAQSAKQGKRLVLELEKEEVTAYKQ